LFRLLSGFMFFLAVLEFAAANTAAQQIQGQVRFSDSGQPVLNALVECDGTGGNSQQFTSRDGRFYFRVSPGHYTVSIRMAGYKQEQQSVDLLDYGSSEYMFFRLKPDAPVAKPITHSTVFADVPPEAQAEFDKAEAALANDKKESMAEGVRHLEKALAIYPKFLQAELRLGAVLMDMGQWDKAELALRKTVEIDPKAANAYFALGELYRQQKKYEEAEKVLQQGLATEPKSARAHLTLARIYWDKVAGVKDEAQWRPPLEKSYEEVKQALALDANLAAAHLLKGNLLFKVRRAEDALKEFEEYLRLDPKGQFAEQTRALVEKIKKALAEQKP
jgi:tetratricopeptide (TPR) repeat protein